MPTATRPSYQDLMDYSIAANEYFADAFAMYPMPFLEYFDVQDTTAASVKSSELSGLSAPPPVPENEDFPEVSPTEGYDVTLTPLKYAQTVPISYELREDDPKGIFSNIQRIVNMHVKAMQQRACVLASTIVNLGFSSGLSPDGQFVFDTDHPTSPVIATTLSNLITTKLDAAGAAIEEMVTKISNNARDMAQNQILFGTWKLVVPPALKGNALKSCVALYGSPYAVANVGVFSGVVGGRPNPTPVQTGEIFRVSTQTGQSIEVVEDPWLGSGYTNGSDVRWIMVGNPAEAPLMHSFAWYWRALPQVVNVSYDQDNFALKVPGLMRCVAGTRGWRHVWGSNGTV